MPTSERIQQREDALALANEVRHKRRRLRIKIHNLPRDKAAKQLAKLIADPPPAMATVRVSVAIDWLYGIGQLRARRILRRASVYRHEVEIRNLSDGERERLVEALKSGV